MPKRISKPKPKIQEKTEAEAESETTKASRAEPEVLDDIDDILEDIDEILAETEITWQNFRQRGGE